MIPRPRHCRRCGRQYAVVGLRLRLSQQRLGRVLRFGRGGSRIQPWRNIRRRHRNVRCGTHGG